MTPTQPVAETPTKSAPAQTPSTKEASAATIHTSMGDITVRLFGADAPKTVENFTKLASSGFYEGIKFHRVIKGFMIQVGDPLSKDDTMVDAWGSGGPGYKFADEIDPQSALYKKGYKHGVLAMANSGPNTNGSQFFIMAADYPLPPLYTIFGEVTEGLSVVDAIDAVKTDGSAQTGGHDRPLTPVVIKSIKVQ
jgi:cyclophilin family peptidyl-prolyl cis-trans isomerase